MSEYPDWIEDLEDDPRDVVISVLEWKNLSRRELMVLVGEMERLVGEAESLHWGMIEAGERD